MLHRLTSSSSPIHDTHATLSPEGRGPIRCSRSLRGTYCPGCCIKTCFLLTHATAHAAPVPQTQNPVPREQPAEASSPTEELQQRASDLTGQGQVDSEAVWHPFDDRDPECLFPDDEFLMSWAAECPTWIFSQYREKNCSSALRPNCHRGESRAFQGHAER